MSKRYDSGEMSRRGKLARKKSPWGKWQPGFLSPAKARKKQQEERK